jgi:hypothetical protein
MALRHIPLHPINQSVELTIIVVLSYYLLEEVDDFMPFVDELLFVERDATAEMV